MKAGACRLTSRIEDKEGLSIRQATVSYCIRTTQGINTTTEVVEDPVPAAIHW